MNNRIILIILASIALFAFKTDKPAYLIYDAEGKQTDYKAMLKAANKADVVLFGEFHNNPISHWLQIELASDMADALGANLVLGAEMFESDGQLLLNEYIEGKISTRSFESQARLWPNYKTDYKPLVELAKEKEISFVASNVPRRYASIVSQEGFEGLEGLDKHAKRFIAPLPIPYDATLPAYKQMLEMGGMHGMSNENFPKAQALKDATMAHFILENLDKGKTSLHFNGAFHSDNQQGIYWYLKEYKKKTDIVTISTVTQSALDSLESQHLGRADFIIVVPEKMTTTH